MMAKEARIGMIWFAIASLTPAGLLGVVAFWGGAWPALALAYMTAFVFVLDRHLSSKTLEGGGKGRGLAVALAGVHFVLLLMVMATLPRADLGVGQLVCAFIAYSLFFGQVSMSMAHELIHAGPRWQRALGAAVYTSLLFGHHVSAHLQVHHAHAATAKDPNTSRMGEHFYHFYARAWIGSFRAGLAAERARGTRVYRRYIAGGLLGLALAFGLGGAGGLALYIGVCIYAQMQLLMSDYVQHYGLHRRQNADGRVEPMGPQHSWNAPHAYSSAMMLNAPRHSDHHMNPRRSFEDLELDPDIMPVLPHSLPVMALIAAVPPLWRRIMDPRVARLQAQSTLD